MPRDRLKTMPGLAHCEVTHTHTRARAQQPVLLIVKSHTHTHTHTHTRARARDSRGPWKAVEGQLRRWGRKWLFPWRHEHWAGPAPRCRQGVTAGAEMLGAGRTRGVQRRGAPSPGEPAQPARAGDSGPGLSVLIHMTDACREASGHSPHRAPGQRPSGQASVPLSQPQRRAVLNVLASCRCQKLSHHTHSGPGRGKDGLAEPEGTRHNPVPQGCRGALSDARRLTCLSAAAVQQNAVTLKFKQRLSPGQSQSRALTVVSGPPGQNWGLGGVARVSTPLLGPLGLFP